VPTGFTNADLTIVGGTVSAVTQDLTLDPSGKTYTATFTATDGFDDGAAILGSVTVTANSYTDAAGNLGGTGTDTVNVERGAAGATDDTIQYYNRVGLTLDGGLGIDTLLMIGTEVATVDLSVPADQTNPDSTTVLNFENVNASAATVAVNLTGSALANVLTGGSQNDTINGGDGGDTLTGGAGIDTINGGTGIDTINGGLGNDILTGGADNDTLNGDDGDDNITGDAGIDTINGGLGNDTLTGGADNDIFNVTSGIDSITDLSGNDVLVVSAGATVNATVTAAYAAVAAPASSNAGTATLTSNGFNVDLSLITTTVNGYTITDTNAATGTTINGSDGGADTITGGAGIDTLRGRGGNDTFLYANNAEFIAGNAVIDTVGGDAGTDSVVIGGAITIIAADSLARASTVENLKSSTSAAVLAHSIVINNNGSLSGFTTIDLSGSTNTGSSSTVNLTGVTAAVTIVGTAGADAITGGSGADTITGGTGVDTLLGGIGNDTFLYASNAEFIAGNAVIDDVRGEGNIDSVVIGGAIAIIAADSLARASTMENLRSATDAVSVLAHSIVISSNANLSNFTTIDLSGSTNTGSSSTVNLTGVTAAVTIVGTAGIDTITGGTGADIITGGAGADTLAGAAGNDIYSYASTAEVAGDVITEAAAGGTDTLRTTGTADLSALIVNEVASLRGAGGATEGIEQILIATGTTATFAGAQLTGNTIAINESTNTGTTNLIINVAAGATNTFANLSFTAAGGDAFDNGVDTITINGNTGIENITGTAFADTINGGAGADTINGGASGDILIGGAGADIITGGTGTDDFHWNAINEFGDIIIDGAFNAGGNSDDMSFSLAAINIGNNNNAVTYAEGDNAAINVAGNEVNVKTDASVLTANIQSTIDGYTAITTGALFVFHDSTKNIAVVYYDANPNAIGGATLVAELSNITSLTDFAATFNGGDFIFI